MDKLKIAKKNGLFLIFVFGIIINFIECKKDENNSITEFKLNTPDKIDSLEYQIYESLFQYFNIDTFLIAQETLISRPKVIKAVHESLSKTELYDNLDTTIFTDFTIKNDTDFNLDKRLLKIGTKQVILLPKEEIDYYFAGKDKSKAWENYSKKYLKKYFYNFSRVGYNVDRDQAIIEFIVTSEDLDAEPTSVVNYLIFKNGKWVSVYTVILTYD